MSEGNSLLDIGCGIAEAATAFPGYKYTGVDLPHIIEKAARVKNPQTKFIAFNANKDSYDFVGDYDIVLMNSFINEIPDWYKCLNNVLYNSRGYVVIHRQETTSEQSHLREYTTYAGLRTTNSVINYDELKRVFYFNELNIIYETNSFPNNQKQKTFLLRKSSND
jgi:SAM-dependent methyltransferase